MRRFKGLSLKILLGAEFPGTHLRISEVLDAPPHLHSRPYVRAVKLARPRSKQETGVTPDGPAPIPKLRPHVRLS